MNSTIVAHVPIRPRGTVIDGVAVARQNRKQARADRGTIETALTDGQRVDAEAIGLRIGDAIADAASAPDYRLPLVLPVAPGGQEEHMAAQHFLPEDHRRLTRMGRLIDLEGVIGHGRETFIEVGEALLAIRDERLYRDKYKTFATYCAERWGFSRSYGYRLIQAAADAAVSPDGDIPATEGEARRLRQTAVPRAVQGEPGAIWSRFEAAVKDLLTLTPAQLRAQFAEDGGHNSGQNTAMAVITLLEKAFEL